jgi:hypothetical protein
MSVIGFVSEFLSFLEQQEARLLSWGFYNVSFSISEVEDLLEQEAPDSLLEAWQVLQGEGWTISTLVNAMESSNLLYRASLVEEVYRTRFAEGVRLLGRLRQIFKPQDWASGPKLVSDIKLHLAPRRYPRRDHSAADCWKDLDEICWRRELQKAAFDALTMGKDSQPLNFSRFQRQAFKNILSRYRGRGSTGSVISAGTGAGKTKAFYIPAFLGVMAELAPRQSQQQSAFTKIVAIYPRNVLLADQLREALSEASKLRPVIERFNLRPLTFGALLGTTAEERWFHPDSDGRYEAERRNWTRIGNGFVVPFIKSPIDPSQDLVWRDADRQRGMTALYRADGSAQEPDVPDGTLALTREQLKANPPDVLFLSAEMLNREMGNPEWARTFGIGMRERAPRLLLLDEVHAYEGIHGAQVAWVLRRWRYWSGARDLHVVGLSATLKEAPKHLGLVTGIPAASIQEFAPADSDLTMEGMEYNLAIKGDPASGSSLLATSIQSAMLLTRLLTPGNLPLARRTGDQITSSAFYGRKVFGFTDNLDGLNRWYSDMNDAERNKRLARFRLHPQRRQPVANLSAAVIRRMDEEGQIWELPRRLGYNLSQPLFVSRCSSQDPGANAGSDLIVASASLEVGFDDPEVGIVLHHKRPISISSFIQRKGRAGRRVGTRPWTVVVLSDYGGDRWAFQNAERLFQPEIETIFLPISNPYVLRIQATYFLVDWLGHRIANGSPFNYLSRSQSGNAARRAIEILEDFINLGAEWRNFRSDFARAFGRPYSTGGRKFSDAELDAIFWQLPRPILRHVVPTLLRKLEANWRYANPQLSGQTEDRGANRPLPQFLPQATFAELGGSDARLIFFDQADKDDEYLNVSRALFESCPGRVSKRYAIRVGEEGYWLAFSAQLLQIVGGSTAPVSVLFPDRLFLENTDGVAIYQPQTIELRHRHNQVLDSSNASWNWQSRIQALTPGPRLAIFASGPWSDVVSHCEVHLHRDQSGISVLRYARSCDYELRLQDGTSNRGRLTLASTNGDGDTVREAVGFQLNVDGIALHLKREHLQNVVDNEASRQSRFRPDYFQDRVRDSEVLRERMSIFLADWLWQTSLAMLAATALREQCSLEEAQQRLTGLRVQAARRVLDMIFQFQGINQQGDPRLKDRILDQWRDPIVLGEMETLERILWASPDADYHQWVRRRYVASLAQAFRTAAVSRLNEISEDDLMVDVVWTAEGDAEIYLTETSSGGLGQIEMIINDLKQSPEAFLEGFRHALSFCPRHFITTNLLAVLRQVNSTTEHGSQLRSAFAQVRAVEGFQAQDEARRGLRVALEEIGLDSSRALVVALVTKLLRAGSSPRTDVILHLLNRAWRRHEERLGISIDPRVFAYLCLQYLPVQRRLRHLFREVSGGVEPDDTQLYAVLQQFLLSGCEDSCPECLNQPHRYHEFGRPSRSLVLDQLRFRMTEVSVDAHFDDWLDLVRQQLLSNSELQVIVNNSRLPVVAREIQELLAEELEAGFLLRPVSIAGVKREGADWKIHLQLKGGNYGA